MGTKRYSAIFTFLFLFFISHGNAQSKISLQQISLKSDLIVTGSITSVKSYWNENHDRILSTIKFLPIEFLKGEQADTEIEIIQPGGEVDNIGELYSHVPVFHQDENVLLFLKRNNSKYYVAGGKLGKISIPENNTDNSFIFLKQQIKEFLSTSK